jgi:hypothetical protein
MFFPPNPNLKGVYPNIFQSSSNNSALIPPKRFQRKWIDATLTG